MKLRKWMATCLSVAMMATMLTACGGGGSTTSAGAGTTAAATGNEQQAGTEQAGPSGPVSVKVGYSNAWDSMTPFRSNTVQDAPYAVLIYEHLINYDQDNNAVPWVVKSWETDDGGYTYHVELYDGIVDSAGNAYTAEDAVWQLQESMTQGLRPIYTKLESVTQTGDLTFDVALKTNNVNTIEDAMYCVLVVTKEAYEASPDGMANQPVTTSRYAVSDHVPGSSFKLTLQENHWMPEDQRPDFVQYTVDEIEFKIIKEAAQMGIALETGDIDVAYQMGAATAISYIDQPGYTLNSGMTQNGAQMFFSGGENRVIADDVYLRQAICHAIDVDGLITTVAMGYGKKMYDSAADVAIGWDKDWMNESYYEYDVEKAKELLAKSNYNGEPLVLLTGSGNQRMAEMIKAYMDAVGINLELNLAETAILTSIRLDGTQYDMFVNTVGGITIADHWSTRYDPNGYAAGDACSRKDFELGELIDKASTVDGFTKENIQAVHEYIRDNCYGYGMYQPAALNLYRDDLGITEVVVNRLGNIQVALCTYGGK